MDQPGDHLRPRQLPALLSGLAALVGLLLSFLVRRRRVFVRVIATPTGPTVVEAGGLARSDSGGGFGAEFTLIAADLKTAHTAGSADGGAVAGSGAPLSSSTRDKERR